MTDSVRHGAEHASVLAGVSPPLINPTNPHMVVSCLSLLDFFLWLGEGAVLLPKAGCGKPNPQLLIPLFYHKQRENDKYYFPSFRLPSAGLCQSVFQRKIKPPVSPRDGVLFKGNGRFELSIW